MNGALPDLRGVVTALQDDMQVTADRLADIVRGVAPVDTSGDPNRTPGQLRDSLQGEAEPLPDGVRLAVVTDAPYAEAVLRGHGPIDKEPGFLHFYAGGEEVFTHHVNATDPNPFPELVDGEIQGEVDALIGRALEKVWRQ